MYASEIQINFGKIRTNMECMVSIYEDLLPPSANEKTPLPTLVSFSVVIKQVKMFGKVKGSLNVWKSKRMQCYYPGVTDPSHFLTNC